MFGKTQIIQNKPFQLSVDEIAQDIEAISLDEEQRNKLYLCLDITPPQNDQFYKVEDFLKQGDSMEKVKWQLETLIREVDGLIEQIHEKVTIINQSVIKYNSGS